MAISKKHRRSISVDGTNYIWWVAEDVEDEFVGTPALTVASEDRHLLVCYGLMQPDTTRYAVVRGRRFQAIPDAPGPWRRFHCPPFGDLGCVTPNHVAEFIRWCVSPAHSSTEVDYSGRPLLAPAR
jgi:hypothetical protein